MRPFVPPPSLPAALVVAVATLLWNGTVAAIEKIPSGYVKVANAHGVPPEILYAISRAESNRAVKTKKGESKPWPWTLNVEGQAVYFDTRREAYDALRQYIREGRTVDVGPAQVSWNHHRSRLIDGWKALDPYHNLNVGAQILREMFETTCAARCDWWRAIGLYHSPRDAERAQRYRLRVARYLKEALHD